MNDEEKRGDETRTGGDYHPPAPTTSTHRLARPDGRAIDYVARADWIAIRKRERPIAEIFHVAYMRASETPDERPLTFVFNGGPGAASAYLHMGAVGPKRVVFTEEGRPPPPPARIEDNPASWLAFTDLVFIDPVGTGFSRALERPDAGDGVTAPSKKESAESTAQEKHPEPEKEFFGLQRDLESLGEFIRSFLSKHLRWDSPIFIAGESYGGFRVAKLARLLQERYGVGLNGALLISPALELNALDSSDYDVLPWLDTYPTMALAAAAHGRQRGVDAQGSDEAMILAVRETAEAFATERLVSLLTRGDTMPESDSAAIYARIAEQLGLDPDYVARNGGRIRKRSFARELLRDERRVIGLYDAASAVTDPFPDRDDYEGPDATLMAIDRVFSAGINTQLRRTLGVDIERDYHLLNFDVNRAWKLDYERHVLQTQIGASDDLRYALQLNPFLQVRISHGIYDLVTPYFSSERIVANMKLDAETGERVSLRHYRGGHMFYTWRESREAFAADVRALYQNAIQS